MERSGNIFKSDNQSQSDNVMVNFIISINIYQMTCYHTPVKILRDTINSIIFQHPQDIINIFY